MMKKGIAILMAMLMLSAGTLPVSAEEIGSAKDYIEDVLNLDNNAEQSWTYNADSDSWTLSVVSAVAYPVLPDQQGVSVCVPGAYVKGIDTDGDGKEDVTALEGTEGVFGSLVIERTLQQLRRKQANT